VVRDPKRIPRILDQLADLWRQVPDQRLGQLVCNYLGCHEDSLWYIEDDETERLIRDAIPSPHSPIATRQPVD
jgi:hypothetical protein